ncbi:MAG: RtcB family protein [Phycisphaerales bacterium]|nr:RtcB family protein [Phycisphaerales bacterium]
MATAAGLPVSAAGALMPDAHVGYGLPIGGVLATRDAVIPYAVGVDIACRVMVSVFDAPAGTLERRADRLRAILERQTLFGVGRSWPAGQGPDHPVLHEDWSFAAPVRALQPLARSQIGTSGSGNHFVEWGLIEFLGPCEDASGRRIAPGSYLAVVSHSGSRGPGARTCDHYSKVARDLHPDLPRDQHHLAWLPLSGPHGHLGHEYWAAMELMGRFASANHHIIHGKIRDDLGQPLAFEIENHHNFAWKDTHRGEELIVHRKGATPAGPGVLGYIPGSMTAPGYLVRGLGAPEGLHSASHGAGRRLSRTKCREQTTRQSLSAAAREAGVDLLSAGLDEAPWAYKDIDEIMAAQRDLVEPVARFTPRIVRMAPEGEKAED